MTEVLTIKANTEVLGFYQKQKSEFHFQEKTDNEFLMFLLDTAVRVISIVQHLAPVIEAVSDANAESIEGEIEEIGEHSPSAIMEIDEINKEVNDIIHQPPTAPPPAPIHMSHPPAPSGPPTISTQIGTQSVTVPDMPALQPTPAPQSASQSTATSSTAIIHPPAYEAFAPAPEDPDSVKEEGGVAEMVTVKNEIVDEAGNTTLDPILPPDTIQQLMTTIQNNEENIGIANLVTTAQPSSLNNTLSNNPLSMLSLSNTANNLNSFLAKGGGAGATGTPDNLPGSSRETGELRSLLDPKGTPGGGTPTNPTAAVKTEPVEDQGTVEEQHSSESVTYVRALALFHKQHWELLLDHLKTSSFQPSDHGQLQNMWYHALYEVYKRDRGLATLTPTQRYRIRQNKAYELPPTLRATKFSAGNFFDEQKRAILDNYYIANRYLRAADHASMVRATGLTLTQIKNYLKNKRCRSKPGRTRNEKVGRPMGTTAGGAPANSLRRGMIDVTRLFNSFPVTNLGFSVEEPQQSGEEWWAASGTDSSKTHRGNSGRK